MSKAAASVFFFLSLFNILTISSSATLVGFSYNARVNTSAAASTFEIDSVVIEPNNFSSAPRIRVHVADRRVLNLTSLSNSNASVDLYLNLSLVGDLTQSELSATSWLETNVLASHSRHVNIKSIILSCSSEEFAGKNVLPLILSALRSFHSALNKIHLSVKFKVSVAFPLPLLEKLNISHDEELGLISGFIKKTGSAVIIEVGIDQELSMADFLVQSLIKKAIKASSVLPDSDILIDLVIKSPFVPSSKQVAEFIETVSKFLENNFHIDGLYSDVASMGEFVQKEVKMVGEKLVSLSRRGLVSIHDTTVFPTTPFPQAPVLTIPPDYSKPKPTIVTVPATNPVTVQPANPDATPLPIPPMTPVLLPPATPVNPAAPITNPATTPAPVAVPGGAPPVTNPVTTYPPPAGNVPGSVPVTPPATTNAPAIPGQSWCVAKSGVSETALQQALDYACGIGGADCSSIQQGGSCYNPNSLQNHASYAFNSYYQKKPSPNSCDFGGTAMTTNTNPSTGTCVYPSSSSSSPPSTPASTPPPASTTPPAQPSSMTPPAATTTPPVTTSPGPGIPGSVSPPGVLNSSNPAGGFDSPPFDNNSTSTSVGSQLILSSLTLVTSIMTGLITLQI